MTNPVPAPVRAWLYVIGATIAAVSAVLVNVLPDIATTLILAGLAGLNVLARANVPAADE